MNNDKCEWYKKAKLGMQITWGGFSVFGRGENVLFNEKIPLAEYKAAISDFKAIDCDPISWVKTAKHIGMQYIIMTARHVDGYCLFESKFNDFNSKLLILDEPERNLSVAAKKVIQDFVLKLKENNIACIYITHEYHYVYPVADRIVLISQGRKVLDIPKANISQEEMEDYILRHSLIFKESSK